MTAERCSGNAGVSISEWPWATHDRRGRPAACREGGRLEIKARGFELPKGEQTELRDRKREMYQALDTQDGGARQLGLWRVLGSRG